MFGFHVDLINLVSAIVQQFLPFAFSCESHDVQRPIGVPIQCCRLEVILLPSRRAFRLIDYHCRGLLGRANMKLKFCESTALSTMAQSRMEETLVGAFFALAICHATSRTRRKGAKNRRADEKSPRKPRRWPTYNFN
jgi:hypothetical protein